MFELPRCALVGMVHLLPLPSSPRWGGSMQQVREAAMRDARRLVEGGVDALIVENMGDVPYVKGGVPPEVVAAMALVTAEVVSLGVPVGVQILAGANREAMAVATVSGAHFVRVEGFAYAHVADEGWIDACAGPLLRARASLGSQVQIWADVQKKHASHAVTADLSIEALARGAAFCGADALIITGAETGAPTHANHLVAARAAGLPVVVGSGVDANSAADLAPLADALIVGTSLKEHGDWRRPVELERVQRLADVVRASQRGEEG